MRPSGVFRTLSGGRELSASSEQHSSSCSVNVTLISFGAQGDCSAWAAQIVRQLSDRPQTLSASANASRLFIMLGQYLIGGDYNECLRGRQRSS